MDVAAGMTRVSLRRTALIWMSATLAIVGCVAAIIAFLYVHSESAELLDGQLRQIALNAGDGVNGADAAPSEDADPEDQVSITIWDANGHIAHRSEMDAQIPRQRLGGYTDVTIGDNSWRVYTTGAGLPSVQVAQRETVRAEIANHAAFTAAAPVLSVIPLSWLIVGWAMTRALRRLDALARDIALRSVEAVAPLDIDGIPIEIAPLALSMNGLIARLQAAVETQKQFIADAAHELRTPLAAMRIQVDNMAQLPPLQIGACAADLARGVQRASSLVNQLLRLAKLDEAEPISRDAVELRTLLIDCIAEVVPLAHGKDVDLGLLPGSAATCIGSAAETSRGRLSA